MKKASKALGPVRVTSYLYEPTSMEAYGLCNAIDIYLDGPSIFLVITVI